LVAFIAYSFSLFLFEVSRYWLNGNWYILFKDILRSAVVMVFLLSKYEAEPVEMLMTSGLITCLITLAVVLIRSYGSTPEHSGMSPKLFWSVYTKGLSLSLGSGLQVFKGWLEVFLAGAFLPLGQVALYSVVQKLGKLVNLPLVALNADIAKGLARLAEGHQLSDRHRQLIRLSKLTTFAFAMLALLCSPWFLKFYGYPAEPLFLILCVTVILCNVLNVFFGPVGLYFQLSDMRDYFVRSTAVSLVITLILAFTTVPWLGLNGLAIATLISGTLWNYMLHRRMVNTTGNSFL
jgi:O-antigen/teichoic acid export membrane protein